VQIMKMQIQLIFIIINFNINIGAQVNFLPKLTRIIKSNFDQKVEETF
jgi:hypothetical protein